jgi:predicted CxxxxCH...CXXCH cytochrome family protein
MKKILIFCTFAIIISGLFGCSERKEDTPLVQSKVSLHDEGFSDPSSANFHAKYIQTKNYDLTLCQSCHGGDYSGGTTGQSCNSCHNKTNGPENCTTCHGVVNAAPPKDLADNVAVTFRGVGAHQKHVLGGTLGAAVACKTCHVVPTTLKSPGHIDASMYAEVKFDTTSIFYEPIASYSPSSISCGNTYCHGNFNGGNQGLAVTWTDNSGNAVQCGTCHGDITKSTLKEKAFPKTGHTAATVTSDCSTCHSSVVNSNLAIIDPSRHVNGRLN